MSRCFLFPTPASSRRPSYLHESGGLSRNWALDFMAAGGSPVLSPVDATVARWSGHSPSEGELPGAVFGWTMYLEDAAGYVYFLTHLGRRFAKVGSHVCRGQRIALVGHWPADPGRSHLHLGVTSPKSVEDAKATVRAIAGSIRLAPAGGV